MKVERANANNTLGLLGRTAQLWAPRPNKEACWTAYLGCAIHWMQQQTPLFCAGKGTSEGRGKLCSLELNQIRVFFHSPCLTHFPIFDAGPLKTHKPSWSTLTKAAWLWAQFLNNKNRLSEMLFSLFHFWSSLNFPCGLTLILSCLPLWLRGFPSAFEELLFCPWMPDLWLASRDKVGNSPGSGTRMPCQLVGLKWGLCYQRHSANL